MANIINEFVKNFSNPDKAKQRYKQNPLKIKTLFELTNLLNIANHAISAGNTIEETMVEQFLFTKTFLLMEKRKRCVQYAATRHK